MGALDLVRGRETHQIATAGASFDPDRHAGYSGSSTSNSTLGLEEQNEKETQAQPDQITADAQAGVQEAEAAALVWSKKAVFLTYA